MQKWAPRIIVILMAWLGVAHAAESDYIIQGNATPLNPMSITSPAQPAPPTPAALAPAVGGALPVESAPVTPTIKIGVLLPTGSADFGEAAEVVSAGMNAAAKTEGQAKLVFVDEQSTDLLARYRALVSSGVNVIVGPLTRPGIVAIAAHASVPTLVLNAIEHGLKVSPLLFSLSLTVEGEARQVAHIMYNDGRGRPLVIGTHDALSRRLTQAFMSEWKKQVGTSPMVLNWPFSSSMTASLARADAVFIALTPAETSELKSILPLGLSVYATSQLNTRKPDPSLEGIRFIDMPWFLMPQQDSIRRYPPPSTALTMQTERLYALGIDAYRLALLMARGKLIPNTLKLSGVTGELRLGYDHQFERVLPLAVMAPENGGR